ncbi:hypothetical protein DMENIID0001_117580 [Sergentomyia squamirostris]
MYWSGEDEGLETLCEVLFQPKKRVRLDSSSSVMENQEWYNESESWVEYSFSALFDLNQMEANSYGYNRIVEECEDNEIISTDDEEEQEEELEEQKQEQEEDEQNGEEEQYELTDVDNDDFDDDSDEGVSSGPANEDEDGDADTTEDQSGAGVKGGDDEPSTGEEEIIGGDNGSEY